MKITKRQLKRLINEFLDTKSYSGTAVSSKFAQDFAKGYEAAFTQNGLKPDYNGLDVFEAFKPYFTEYIQKYGNLNESKEGDPKGGLRHFIKFLAYREREIPTMAGFQTDYQKILGDDPESSELADRWDKVSGDMSAEADLERREIRRQLPKKFDVGGYRPIKFVDSQNPENFSLKRDITSTILGDEGSEIFHDEFNVGTAGPFEDFIFSIFPALVGSIPPAFFFMYMVQTLFPSIDSEIAAAGFMVTSAFTLGLLIACSSSAQLFKLYKQSLQKAGDKLNTPYGGNIALEEYAAFLDEEYEARYEEEKEKAIEKAKERLEEVDQNIVKMIETKKNTIEEFYREREERLGKRQKDLIDITPEDDEEED